MKEFHFPHPDDIGASEDRPICDCLDSGLEDCPAEECAELAEAILEEFIGHAKAMLKQVREQSAQADGGPDLTPTRAADEIPADAACEIVAAIRKYMFLKNGRWQWRDLSGADFIEFVTLLLSQHDLIPANCE